MIIQFTVENFLSFKEAATLSLAASALKEKQTSSEDIVFELTGTNLSLLKSAVVYGANASGKSNLIKALDFFKWFVINSSKGVQSGERIQQVESFRLNRSTENEPSYFEAVFADEQSQYRYGFEVDEKRVYREWLYQKSNKKKAKEVELFLRNLDEYELHPKFAVGKEVVAKKMVRDNALLLSVAAQFNETVSVEIMEWLANTTIVRGSSDERIWKMATQQIDNPE
ncbi:AAA family ATPase, partial [Bacteroides cellulosilyticus]|uniref:AAA family ATPase n=1 Tax=Bacteroides cellulosilyticus TaxID=246787 RepID=UPI001230FB1F